jgi:hypothetical protein
MASNNPVFLMTKKLINITHMALQQTIIGCHGGTAIAWQYPKI